MSILVICCQLFQRHAYLQKTWRVLGNASIKWLPYLFWFLLLRFHLQFPHQREMSSSAIIMGVPYNSVVFFFLKIALVSVIIADVQTPAQPTPALSTVVPKKPQTPGEEQIKAKTPREASHKQFTTSEYSNLVNIGRVVKLPAQTRANQFVTLLLLLAPSNLCFLSFFGLWHSR